MFKNSMFVKLMIIFTLITVITVVTFSYLMYAILYRSIVDHELTNQQNAMDSVSEYVNAKYTALNDLIQDIYRDRLLSSNLVYFMQHPYEDYIKFRLDQPYESTNLLNVLKNQIMDDIDLQNIILYSSSRHFVYEYGQGRGLKLISANPSRSYIPDYLASNSDVIAIPNIWMRKAVGQTDTKLYALRRPLTDPWTMQPLGDMIFYFQSQGIEKALAAHRGELRGDVLVLTPDGDVIYDSSDTYYGRKYPYLDELDTLHGRATLQEPSYVSTITQSRAGYIVASIVPVREIDAAADGLRRTILLVSVLAIAVVVLVPSLFIANYAKRTQMIIRFMSKAESGNLSARLPEQRRDELGTISRSFNLMLEELTKHIDRVYKAEIEQRSAELSALQARVNPHFLYNTLEVIRMRAVAQGAHDVAEMIYSLAMLFKVLVQQKADHTLRDELEYCRLYLELFRIRYKDKFAYEIDCEPAIARVKVVRMLLQPVIENYIVHGIRTEASDNRIRIWARQEGERIRIGVEDNGAGMTAERAAEVRSGLQAPEAERESFGLRSVNDRIRLTYGSEYGMSVDSVEGAGTTVIVTIPAVEAEGGSKGDV